MHTPPRILATCSLICLRLLRSPGADSKIIASQSSYGLKMRVKGAK
jgi:hypothetical protein